MLEFLLAGLDSIYCEWARGVNGDEEVFTSYRSVRGHRWAYLYLAYLRPLPFENQDFFTSSEFRTLSLES